METRDKIADLINSVDNKNELSRKSGVSINQIIRISKHGAVPSLTIAEKLLSTMGYRLNIVKGRRRK